ncbi:M23 family metallopeptidase [Arthrobacter sp. zg-Y179]|uniref:M23 family metallopeptidase n=1 Tax=Arthrobacter sp. zg-Y179 TaxID=2894188 RepID=UPI001E59CF09|nr:M23 family metallopeptidase [Arthrobacter sp. zg-Y179]MCC9175995.1 M23 family metallopeptidase [Arthrobacter sp. zg-Y179]
MKRTHALLLAAVLAVFVPGAAAVGPLSAATAARTATATAPAPAYSPPWTWPLAPAPALLRPFDPPARQWLAGHRGIDVAAAEGSAVLAPADGRVIFARRVVDRPVLTIDHGGGLKSSFEPVEASVPVGTVVSKGTAVGSVRPGSHCGPGCMHWGVRLNGEYVDPLAYVSDRRPSVLLPLGPRTSR